MNDRDWESICKKCGKCCYEKVDLGGGIIRYTDEPCVFLDVETNMCRVYENRSVAEPDCISLTEHLVRTLKWLPEDCAYLEHIRHLDTLAAVQRVEKRKKRAKRRR